MMGIDGGRRFTVETAKGSCLKTNLDSELQVVQTDAVCFPIHHSQDYTSKSITKGALDSVFIPQHHSNILK